jgi:hypothetical protein
MAMGDDAERVILAELGQGEKLLWSGRPRQGMRPAASDAFLVPFSLFWCGFAVFWEKSALAMNTPAFFKLWGLPFIAFGVYLVFGRFIADAVRRSKVFYGLTDRRVIIVSGVFARELKSLDLAALGEISVRERADRSGTISLGTATGPFALAARMSPSWPGTRQYLPPMLEMIEDAQAVYERIRAQQTR